MQPLLHRIDPEASREPAIPGASTSSGPKAPGPAAIRIGARVLYWAPVLAVLVLFGQAAFLGLRPALFEARRLSAAEVVLQERHDRAAALNREIAAQLAARADPIYRERQRRAQAIRRVSTEG